MKLIVAPLVVVGLALAGVGVAAQSEAEAEASGQPTISIKDFMYAPAETTVKAGEAITIANSDSFSHTVTAKDGTFDLDVPANGSVTLKVAKQGAFPYTCTYHPGQHNPATINVS